MCGIIGFKGSFTPGNVALVRGLLEQSQIRGKHATGVSYLHKGAIKTLKEPSPVHAFLLLHWDKIVADLQEETEISLIAHTRYSTSGLEHNQPYADEVLSVAFNGVVTQADPSRWKELYGFEPKTTNDVEILHHVMSEGGDPLSQLGTASLAVVALKRNGVVIAFRNGYRPMYTAHSRNNPNTVVVASTMQILTRAGIPDVDVTYMESGRSSHLCKDKDEFGDTVYAAFVSMNENKRDLQTEKF